MVHNLFAQQNILCSPIASNFSVEISCLENERACGILLADHKKESERTMTKKLLILTTGGTIASVETPHGLIPALTSEELLSYLPEIGNDFVTDYEQIYHKKTFGSYELFIDATLDDNQRIYQTLFPGNVDSITLIGLCTDICVITNALLLKTAKPEVPIIVDASCCAGVTPESHKNALAAMKMCQIEIVNEEE